MSNSRTSRFDAAKRALKNSHLDPVVELMEAANALVEHAEERATRAETVMETLRPVWAQGWTDDGVAAQASASALAGLWQMLGVNNQTDAVERLGALIHQEQSTEQMR